MKQVETIEAVRAELNSLRNTSNSIAFVPTMGALHEGHLALIRHAKKFADKVVVSIYVNPEQFGPNEDFESYPRQISEDLKLCEKEQVALVFTPNDEEMYGYGEKKISFQISEMNEHMDGGSRPGFFEGIVLVVNKLFNIIRPDVAVFGQKDIQQFMILSRMVREFNHNIQMEMAPIQRANDGLALSSRNVYLSKHERELAPGLYRSLKYIEKNILQGVDKPALLLRHQQDELKAKGFKNDYLDVFAAESLQPVKKLEKGNKYILTGAVYLGKTRLIDNLILDF